MILSVFSRKKIHLSGLIHGSICIVIFLLRFFTQKMVVLVPIQIQLSYQNLYHPYLLGATALVKLVFCERFFYMKNYFRSATML